MESKTIKTIQNTDNYTEYLKLANKKASLLNNLEYLLSTIDIAFPITIDFNKPEFSLKSILYKINKTKNVNIIQ